MRSDHPHFDFSMNTSANFDSQKALNDSIVIGKTFADKYYKQLDSNDRASLVGFYTNTSSIVWNGKKYIGLGQIKFILDQIPPSKHHIDTVDCQPSFVDNEQRFLIIVNGMVEYANDPTKRLFTQYFYVTFVRGSVYITSEIMRFVAITNKAVKHP